MDLKTKLMVQAGINEDIAIHIIKSLPLARQKQLCLLDPVQLMQQIPDLMRDANCLDEFEMDPTYNKSAPPKPKTDHLLKDNSYPEKPKITSSMSTDEYEEENSLKKYIILIVLGIAVFGAISSFLPEEESTESNTKEQIASKVKVVEKPVEVVPLETSAMEVEEVIQSLPELPPRGMWMFSLTENYEAKIECQDQRFEKFNVDYTIELWLKITDNIMHEINLIELYENELPIERLFLNDEGQLSFSAGPGFPTLKFKKAIPTNGKHYHIAICKSGNDFKMFINGKRRKEISTPTNFPKSRSGISLLRSLRSNSNLAIDEVRVSSEAIYTKDFIPQRIFSISAITELYMPLEKNERNIFRFYGINNYFESEPVEENNWVNIIYETQVISNQLEKLRK